MDDKVEALEFIAKPGLDIVDIQFKDLKLKGKLNFYYVEDELIEIIDDDSDTLSEEEATELYEKYIEPLLYRPKSKN